MQFKPLFLSKLFLLFLTFSIGTSISAQEYIKIRGTVIDAETKEPLPFANVTFVGTTIGITTDFDGKYTLESQWGSDSLQASYLGYEPIAVKLSGEKKQVIDFQLYSEATQLVEAVVSVKKKKYRKKNNPAVELIRKVIKNKKFNRLESNDYYQYNKYEKVEMDLNNITDKFRNRKAFKKLQFIFDFVDTSEINGKPFLPIYLQETSSRVYYRKDPKSTKEFQDGQKLTSLTQYLDDESIATVMEKLYDDVNIYDNQIMFLTTNFISPLAPIVAVEKYRFYIMDTIQYQGQEVIDLAFYPKNKYDFCFNGNLYITQDTTYRVIKAEMSILKETNINFVKDARITQEFAPISEGSDEWALTKDNIIVDYNLGKKGMGFFGRRTTIFKDHVFNVPAEEEYYGGTEKLVKAKDFLKKDEDFWDGKRPEKLTEREKGTYHMIDTLQTVPVFKRALNVVSFLLTGYTAVGPIDIGPVNSFYSFNDVEGFRPRLGGRTNTKFSKKVQLEGFASYGFKSKQWRYQGSLLYSFNNNFDEYPKHYVKIGTERETRFPGQVLQYFSEDNFFLSFRRGVADKILFYRSYTFDYLKQMKGNVDLALNIANRRQQPAGSFNPQFMQGDTIATLTSLRTMEFGVNIKWSPNAQFWNGKSFQIAMFNKYPIITLDYRVGVQDLFGGEYNFQKVNFKIFKRFYLSVFGYSNLEIESAKVFGENLPYLLLNLPRANQTYAYQIFSFNMMNFLEFASDEFVSVNYQHFFNGFIFNKIPLFKRLKLREVVTFKGMIGRLSDGNNPNLPGNEHLPQFDTRDGLPTTYPLTLDEPYMEASVGVYNMFKFLRVDLVQRLTHLDHPNIPKLFGAKGLGLRVRFKVEF